LAIAFILQKRRNVLQHINHFNKIALAHTLTGRIQKTAQDLIVLTEEFYLTLKVARIVAGKAS
jgi:hypothetical protein